MRVWIKVCGVTTPEDALLCADEGVDAVGLNFVPTSPRCLAGHELSAILQALAAVDRPRPTVIGVVADMPFPGMMELRRDGVAWLQLHGHEPPSALVSLLPAAYKAIRVGSAEDVAEAARYPGDRILVDARVKGQLGGTGVRVDPAFATLLVRTRSLILAGGLTPDNVAGAIGLVKPFGVDVASGVEVRGNPRRKDPAALRAFIAAVRALESENAPIPRDL